MDDHRLLILLLRFPMLLLRLLRAILLLKEPKGAGRNGRGLRRLHNLPIPFPTQLSVHRICPSSRLPLGVSSCWEIPAQLLERSRGDFSAAVSLTDGGMSLSLLALLLKSLLLNPLTRRY